MKRLPLRNLSGPPFRSSFPALLEHEAQVLTRSVAQLLMMSIVWPLGYLLLLGSGVSGLARSAGTPPPSRSSWRSSCPA